jgi:hypothetical protein
MVQAPRAFNRSTLLLGVANTGQFLVEWEISRALSVLLHKLQNCSFPFLSKLVLLGLTLAAKLCTED